jgi:hypothetical protein
MPGARSSSIVQGCTRRCALYSEQQDAVPRFPAKLQIIKGTHSRAEQGERSALINKVSALPPDELGEMFEKAANLPSDALAFCNFDSLVRKDGLQHTSREQGHCL